MTYLYLCTKAAKRRQHRAAFKAKVAVAPLRGDRTVTVRRPRVRDVEERFESRVLPLFKRRSETVSELIPELYLHGLAHGDFDLALRGLLGEDAPLSPSTVSRLKQKWQGEYEKWLARPLEELELVYLWVDGVYVKAGLEKDKAAVLVAVGGLSDGTKIVLTLEAGHRESEASWSSLLRRLELVARIQATLRGRDTPPEPYRLGNLAIHYEERRVTVAGRSNSPSPSTTCSAHCLSTPDGS